MPFRSRNIARETGAALAVLAIYLLVLLAPLHQAAGMQRDLNGLGFTSLDSWSICGQLAQGDEGTQPVVTKCAASGIGKNELAAVDPVVFDASIVVVATRVTYPATQSFHRSRLALLTGQPRAPPMMA